MRKIYLLLVMLAAALPGMAQKDTTYKPVSYPAGYRSQLDVVYTRVNGWEGRMDLYLPPVEGKPAPLVINIHGGGWNHGVKESQTGFNSFFKEGFAVANIEYRLTGQATAPAAVEDTRCALIYIISHAKELHIDAARIVIMGSSAGGHLALMGGLLENDHRFDTNCPGTEGVKVAAIIDKYGITDLTEWATGRVHSKSATSWLGSRGLAYGPAVSPITYVKKSSPPVFIVHGDADPVVGYEQSVRLQEKLQQAGVTHEFMTVPGGQHGKFPAEQNKEMNERIMRFLKQLHLF